MPRSRGRGGRRLSHDFDVSDNYSGSVASGDDGVTASEEVHARYDSTAAEAAALRREGSSKQLRGTKGGRKGPEKESTPVRYSSQ